MKDGGPAYPTDTEFRYEDDNGEMIWRKHPGMSLRQWYAGQALTGVLAALVNFESGVVPTRAQLAEEAYSYADAMIKVGHEHT